MIIELSETERFRVRVEIAELDRYSHGERFQHLTGTVVARKEDSTNGHPAPGPPCDVRTMTPGDRYSVRDAFGDSIYEFTREDPEHDRCNRYVLQLVKPSRAAIAARFVVGYEMHVEAAWFHVRGQMPKSVAGAVRRVP